MDNSQYEATQAGQAYKSFNGFVERILHVTNIAWAGTSITSGFSKFLLNFTAGDESKAKIDKLESIGKDSLLHAMAIMAAWGAFDAFMDDFCKGVLSIDPTILDDKAIKGKSVKVAQLLAPERVKLEIVYEAIKSSIETRKVDERVEETLSLLGLDTPKMSQPITDAFVDSYKIRNVWAHCSGRADSKFVKEAGHLGFNIGDEVSLQLEDTAHYLGAILFYGTAINNRMLLKLNLEPIAIFTDAVGSDLMHDFFDMYPGSPTKQPLPPRSNAGRRKPGKRHAKPIEDSPPSASSSVSDVPPASPTPQFAEESPARTSSTDSAPDRQP